MQIVKSGISVIICCYNSSARLPETLKHLAKQVIPDNIPWEVIVVNNASTDNTSEIAETEWRKYDHPSGKFRIVDEKEPGLSYARQKGAQEASFKYLIFCDDDNWLDSNYLLNALNIMEDNNQIGALGGISTAVTDDVKFPDWFESKQNGFAVGPQSPHQGDVSKTCSLWGAGLITKKELFLRSFSEKYPPILTDRKADSLSSGGDNEFCFRLLLMGRKLYYDESLTFVHFIPKSRCSPEHLKRLSVACEKGKNDRLELNKYLLLHKLVSTRKAVMKPFIVIKIFLGYLSTIFLNRKSWSLADVKVIFYYYTKIDLGVDLNTKNIFNFYKE